MTCYPKQSRSRSSQQSRGGGCAAARPQPRPGEDVLPGLRQTILDWIFFDPDFDIRIESIRSAATGGYATRWDRASVHAFECTYGDYVLAKVGKVFPELRRELQRTPAR